MVKVSPVESSASGGTDKTASKLGCYTRAVTSSLLSLLSAREGAPSAALNYLLAANSTCGMHSSEFRRVTRYVDINEPQPSVECTTDAESVPAARLMNNAPPLPHSEN